MDPPYKLFVTRSPYINCFKLLENVKEYFKLNVNNIVVNEKDKLKKKMHNQKEQKELLMKFMKNHQFQKHVFIHGLHLDYTIIH